MAVSCRRCPSSISKSFATPNYPSSLTYIIKDSIQSFFAKELDNLFLCAIVLTGGEKDAQDTRLPKANPQYQGIKMIVLIILAVSLFALLVGMVHGRAIAEARVIMVMQSHHGGGTATITALERELSIEWHNDKGLYL